MRAWRLRQAGPIEGHPLVEEDVPDPQPGTGQVQLRVRMCGICRTDLHVAEGDLSARRQRVIPGHQIVGEISAVGPEVNGLAIGDRVGVAWLHQTCGVCGPCRAGRENLCERAEFTGWTVDGGFAQRVVAPAAFVYPLPASFSDRDAAPLLCAGIIGYRCLEQTGLSTWTGARLGLYGFGAAGHVALQLARGRGADVYVCTRDRDRHQRLAEELGARWVGDADQILPVPLDAAIIFAPAGPLVHAALAAVAPGATVVLGGIHMTDIPALPYRLLYGERVLRTVANNTRADGRRFLAEAAALPVRTHTHVFPFAQANQALETLKNDGIRGAGVLDLGL